MELLSPAMQLRMIQHVRAFLLQKSDDKVKRASTLNNHWNVRRKNLMEVFRMNKYEVRLLFAGMDLLTVGFYDSKQQAANSAEYIIDDYLRDLQEDHDGYYDDALVAKATIVKPAMHNGFLEIGDAMLFDQKAVMFARSIQIDPQYLAEINGNPLHRAAKKPELKAVIVVDREAEEQCTRDMMFDED